VLDVSGGALCAVDSLVTNVAEARAGSAVAVPEFLRAAVVLVVGEWAHHIGTYLVASGELVEPGEGLSVCRSLVHALAEVVGRVVSLAHEAGLVRHEVVV